VAFFRQIATLLRPLNNYTEAVCMKFRLLLWVLGLMMGKASRTNPAFQQQLGDKDLAFQLQTLDGKVARHFIVKDQRITSRSGVHPAPA
jgi:hypothetical protein